MDPLKYIVPGRKRLPYGMMNFADIRQDNYYYVDKTRFIPMIEEADRFFFFIRPRRFGKSLTLNLLRQYYDVRTRDKFEALFGDLYIGQHPTPSRNSYLVLHLNFSGIGGELNDYRRGLDAHCGITFENFCKIYADLLPQDTLEGLRKANGAVEQLDFLCQACERAGQDMYLFIDEYDHFTNTILSSPESLAPIYGRDAWRRLSARFLQQGESRNGFMHQTLFHHRRKPRDDGRPQQRIQHRHQLFPRAEVQPDDGIHRGGGARNVGLLFSKQPLPPQRGRVDGDDETVVRQLLLRAGMLR